MSELNFKLLPAALLIKNFVKGNPDSNYEKYLLEFVNSSLFFREKSKGQIYTSPENENFGQCDCISDNYSLDFKMLISPNMAKAKNLFSYSICQPLPGITMYGDARRKPSDIKYNPIESAVLHTWFKDLSADKLYQISISDKFSVPAYKDINKTLNAINKPKNILCMLPYEYVFDGKNDIESKKKDIIKIISDDYRSLVDYRAKVQSGYDNYIAFVFENNLITLQFKQSTVYVVDIIALNNSKIFVQLRNLS